MEENINNYNCTFKHWSKHQEIDGLIYMAALCVIILIPGLFFNIAIICSIILDGRNRRNKHLLLSICLSNLIMTGGIPVLMYIMGIRNLDEDLCSPSRGLAAIAILYAFKIIGDNIIVSIHVLYISQTFNTGIKILGFFLTWGFATLMTCLHVFLSRDFVWICLLVLLPIAFIVTIITFLTRYRKCLKTMTDVTDASQEEYHKAFDEINTLKRKLIMVIISNVLIGQFIANFTIWTKRGAYLDEGIIVSLILLSMNILTVPVYVIYEHKIVQKFYYYHCLDHRAIHPTITNNI